MKGMANAEGQNYQYKKAWSQIRMRLWKATDMGYMTESVLKSAQRVKE
jgi:hypothetical protein